MRIRNMALIAIAALPALVVGVGQAQAPAKGSTKAQAKSGAAAPQTEANLGQLMRGVFYPNSNVIFFAQDENPAEVPPAKESSTATDPLQSAYGKWEAVENSALALAEATKLLTIPGRKCANGRNVPLTNADWSVFVQEMRDAGMKAYQAARSKSQDNVLDAADVLTTACANCHDKYRETQSLAERCM